MRVKYKNKFAVFIGKKLIGTWPTHALAKFWAKDINEPDARVETLTDKQLKALHAPKLYLAVCDVCGFQHAHVFIKESDAERHITRGDYPCEHTPLAYGRNHPAVKAHKMRVVIARVDDE